MAITVGTDTYVTVVEAEAFLLPHPKRKEWRCRSTTEQELALVEATRAIDSLRYVGRVAETDPALQVLAWPRSGAFDAEGRLIDSTTAPDAVKRAQAELALHLLEQDFDVDDGIPRNLERVKAGNVELEFSAHLRVQKLPDRVMRILEPILESQNSSRLLP